MSKEIKDNEQATQQSKHDIAQHDTTTEDERQGLNGYRKTDLDLEIEQELRDMMDKGEHDTEKEYKKFKLFSLITTIVIATLAIMRFVHKMM
ncbi:hypothetical protein [Staphylococcus simiae]|uniref:Uncharacterized protein n=1 Tax=Staphylococcus simiae CCM 7213 = CCUG 51256 TaxID=911238 RepID=G5JIA9_9STAP|nr:hypothetical protein [Staphylococcus simiae]EHJ08066.1 hypothetical protein SS7213T_05976 [Staphylococcus simiae CCM 7213 = CCUG 51256]PNZ11997.1 hypothetical protein CD113_07565 [Staphylococcus simiae]SNV82909.1 membrane protein [Staphylococcus simiae]